MKHKCLIIKTEPEHCILHIGFTTKAYKAMEKRAENYCKTSKLISVEIKQYDPDKTAEENALFHVLCRKISKATNMSEELIKEGIKGAYGAEVPNPVYRKGTAFKPMILKSVGDYTEPEMHEIILGAFATGDDLRQYAGYTKLDLKKEYEDYKAGLKERTNENSSD